MGTASHCPCDWEQGRTGRHRSSHAKPRLYMGQIVDPLLAISRGCGVLPHEYRILGSLSVTPKSKIQGASGEEGDSVVSGLTKSKKPG
jgi:hypothetical protein